MEDSGIGLTAEEQRRLFRSYEQAEPGTSRRYGGTGLGLAISKRLVELLGGRIGVHSEPGRTCFWFTLPVGAAVAPEPVPELTGKRLAIASADAALATHARAWAERWGMRVESGDRAEPFLSAGACDVLLLGPDVASEPAPQPGDGAPALLHAWPLAMPAPAGRARMLELPLHPPQFRALLQGGQRSAPLPRPEKPLFQGSDLGALRVLVAEDNPVNQLVIVSLLGHLGLKAEVVGNGEQALDAVHAATTPWDVILMDTEMPHMDGHEATRRIRALEAHSGGHGSWIIALSAHATPDRVREARAAGVDDYLSKPVTRAQVLEALRHAVRNRPH